MPPWPSFGFVWEGTVQDSECQKTRSLGSILEAGYLISLRWALPIGIFRTLSHSNRLKNRYVIQNYPTIANSGISSTRNELSLGVELSLPEATTWNLRMKPKKKRKTELWKKMTSRGEWKRVWHHWIPGSRCTGIQGPLDFSCFV